MIQAPAEVDFFTVYGEGSRQKIEEVIGKGSYGVVCSALDTGEKLRSKHLQPEYFFEFIVKQLRCMDSIT